MQKTQVEEYVNTPVPQDARRSAWKILSVWVGFIIVVGIMSIGGGMAAGMNLSSLIWAIIIGNFILGILAALSGYVGAESGMTFSQLSSALFPGRSAILVSLYAPIALIGWYAIESAIFGKLMGEALELSPLAIRFTMAAAAVLFSITCYLGFRAIHLASMVLVPLIIILGGYAISEVSGATSASFAFGESLMRFDEGIALVIGSWALGVVACFPDIARFARKPVTGALLGFFGIFIFNSLTIFIGAAGAAFTSEYDPALILISAGVPLLAIFLALANIWTTNDNNLYSASLGIARVTPLNRHQAVILCASIGVIAAFFNPADFSIMFKFLAILGTTAPALGGVVLGGYITMRRLRIPEGSTALPAWAGWILGSVASYLVTGLGSVPTGFLVAYIVWLLIVKISMKRRDLAPC